MRGDPDKIIKEELRQRPKTPSELLHACRERGIPRQTYYRHLNKLIRLGEIKEAKYELVEEAIEADREDVEDCVEGISKALRDEKPNILFSRVNDLELLSQRKRVAHFPQVLPSMEECLENPMLVYNSETFKKLVDTLSNILYFEQYYKPPKWGEIVERIQNRISPKVISIVRANPEFPDSSTITFLGRCGRKEAVETIFEKIKSNPTEARTRLDTARALAELDPKHKKLINQHFDALMEEKNPTLVEAAKKLRQETMRNRSIYFRG